VTAGRDTTAATPDRGAAVTIDAVSVALGGVDVLSGVSLSVEGGTFLGLIGPNGAGKTTLLRTVNGVVEPEEGWVRITGEDVHALPSKAASRLVATVPQDTSLSFDFPVQKVVEMGRHPHLDRLGRETGPPDPIDRDADPVERAMERADVTRFADRPVTEVSGGERGRVLLARALAQDAPVLLLDEPTASHDINHQIRTLELVRDLVDGGKTAIAAIHDLDLAARYCDELALLSGGTVAARGDPGSVLEADALGSAFDASVVVSRDGVTGTPSVTALPDRDNGAAGTDGGDDPAGGGDPSRVHVVAGAGRGAGVLPALVGTGFEVSVGVLREGEPDAELAARLGCEVVTVPPFSAVDGAVGRARDLAATADATLYLDVPVGPENEANLEIAGDGSTLVLVETRAFPERNHAGAAARERYATLRERARVVDRENVVEAVANACKNGDDTSGGRGAEAAESRM